MSALRLRLVARRHVDLARVSSALVDGTGDGVVLVRRVWVDLLRVAGGSCRGFPRR